MTPLIFLMALGPIVNWKSYDFGTLVKNTRMAFVVSLLLGLSLIYFQSDKPALQQFKMALGTFLIVWVIGLSLQDLLRKAKGKSGFNFKKLSASAYGMYTAHIGIAVIIIGVVFTSFLSKEKNVRLGPGQSLAVAGYTFKFERTESIRGANYKGTGGVFEVTKNGEFVALLKPEKRQYYASGQLMTEAAIAPSLARDIYIAMGEQLKGSKDWAIRIYIKPFVRFIWLGGLLMMFGGALALSDRRYRKKIKNRIFSKGKKEQIISTEGSSITAISEDIK